MGLGILILQGFGLFFALILGWLIGIGMGELVLAASGRFRGPTTGYIAIGGVLWATGVTLLGYFLGNIPFVKDNIELMLIAIVAVSLVPVVFEAVKHRREAAATAKEIIEHE